MTSTQKRVASSPLHHMSRRIRSKNLSSLHIRLVHDVQQLLELFHNVFINFSTINLSFGVSGRLFLQFLCLANGKFGQVNINDNCLTCLPQKRAIINRIGPRNWQYRSHKHFRGYRFTGKWSESRPCIFLLIVQTFLDLLFLQINLAIDIWNGQITSDKFQ